MRGPFLPSWHVVHPSDRKIEGGRLIFDPLPRFIGRGAELRSRCAARETSIRAGHGILTDEGGDTFISAAVLDPGEEFTGRAHELGASNDQIRGSHKIDHLQFCLGCVTQLTRREAT